MAPAKPCQWHNTQPETIPLVDSVSFALKILEFYSENTTELPLATISSLLSLNQKRTSTLCTTLVAAGYLVEMGADSFRLGSKAKTMGKVYDQSNPFRSLVALYMKELTNITGQSTALYVLDRGKGLCIASQLGHAPLVYIVNIGDEIDLISTGAGRILLAYSAPEAINSILEQVVSAEPSPRHALEFDQLQHDLVHVRQKGVAFANQEKTEGICSVASPILNKDKQIMAALALIGPTHIFKGEGEKVLIDKMMHTNLKIKQLMGS